MAATTCLWMEAGAMSGGSRNQIELPDQVAQLFFDKQALASGAFTIVLPNGGNVTGQLAHREHHYGQWGDIWRVGLPTVSKGGPRYPETLIRLDKVKSQSGYIYYLTVATPDSPLAKQWRNQAKANGSLSRTAGPDGRQFGYF